MKNTCKIVTIVVLLVSVCVIAYMLGKRSAEKETYIPL